MSGRHGQEAALNFVQIEFLWFFTAVMAVYWLAPTIRLQNAVLVAASMFFYGWVEPWFIFLLFGSATLDYLVGRGMGAYPEHRKKLLALSLLGNLGALWWFKYYDFFIENVSIAMAELGMSMEPRLLEIFLPLGISFYTFQTLSYTIDVYRGVLTPRRDYLNYITFVSLFPQLLAGPVERAARLLPQVERQRKFNVDNIMSGMGLALLGVFKKLVIADTLAPYVDQIFVLKDPAAPLVWVGGIAFMMQIYGDLSGYTDIARGTARMLGFELTKNFDKPHLATSTPDAWRRWHISVSTWFRDYVTVPMLGGKEDPSFLRQLAAIFATFIIIGWWHGAGWNFFWFGIWHGSWVAFYLLVTPRVPKRLQENRFGLFLAIQFQYFVVALPGAVLFREPSPSRALDMLLANPLMASSDEWISAMSILCVVGVTYVFLFTHGAIDELVKPRLRERAAWPWLRGIGWATLVLASTAFYRESARDFIYFQF